MASGEVHFKDVSLIAFNGGMVFYKQCLSMVLPGREISVRQVTIDDQIF
jgi:hypothetical protein